MVHTATQQSKICNNCPQYELVGDDLREVCTVRECGKCAWGISFVSLKILLVLFVLLFVVFPLIYKFSYGLQRQAVFLNSVNVPVKPDYDHPEKYGLLATRNFYLKTEEGVSLGVWHVLHQNYLNRTDNSSLNYEELLGDGHDVIIYNHGNSGNRLMQHRIDLYKILRQFFHVIAYDYRSYGDSSPVEPTERGVVRDAMSIYRWVANKTNGDIFVWGHSLGSSISLHSATLLKQEGLVPTGIILEGAFNNMRDEISEFPLARMFKHLPWFYYTVVEPMQSSGFTFKSDVFISQVDSPIMILHAEDDGVVPIHLGLKLHDAAIRSRTSSQGKVLLHKFEGSYHYGHKFICRAPELPDIIEKFITDSKNEVKQKHIGA